MAESLCLFFYVKGFCLLFSMSASGKGFFVSIAVPSIYYFIAWLDQLKINGT